MSDVSFASHLIDQSGTLQWFYKFSSVQAADIDGDGDLDVLSAGADGVAWYPNVNGTGTFGPPRSLVSRRSTSAVCADVDGDGDEDVLCNDGPGEWTASYWLENTDGNGTFNSLQDMTFVFFSSAHEMSLYTADLDTDDDVDLVSTFGGWDEILWFENTDSAGSFGPERIISPSHTLTSSPHPPVHVGDLDGDGDMDVLSVRTRFGMPTGIVWFENTDGKGTFGPQRFVEGPRPNSAYASDIDGDGDLDIVTRACDRPQGATSQIVWYENTDGRGLFAVFPGQYTEWNADCPLEFHTAPELIRAADVDGDGDKDVLSTSGGVIDWYENCDGRGTFGPQQVIANDTTLMGVHVADMDGDADVDVLSVSSRFETSDGALVWYEGALVWYENVSCRPGDSNRDMQFDQQDIVEVLQAARYLTGQPATWEEGDWNGDDEFDQLGIVAALQTGNYLKGPYTGLVAGSVAKEVDQLFANVGTLGL